MWRFAGVAVMTLAGLVTFPSASEAQHFSIGLGHHGWSHYDWHEDWHHPTYVYVPPPVVRDRVIYVQPGTQPAPALAPVSSRQSLSSRQGTPVTVRRNTLPPYRGSGITIINPPEAEVTLSFAVDDQQAVEIVPGQSRIMQDKASYVVEFDRGGDFGTSRKQLTEGTYEFAVTERGWDLVAAPNATVHGKTAVKANPLPLPIKR